MSFFFTGSPRDSYGCTIMKVKYEIYRAENRAGIREMNKKVHENEYKVHSEIGEDRV